MEQEQYEEIKGLVKQCIKEGQANRHDVKDMKIALMGNKEYGVKGVVDRVLDAEEKIEQHDDYIASRKAKTKGLAKTRGWIIGIAGFIGALIDRLIEFIGSN